MSTCRSTNMLKPVKAAYIAGLIDGEGTVTLSPSFAYAIYNRQALELLRQVCPHLKTYKSMRSSLILRDYPDLTPCNGKYTESQKIARKKFETAVLGIKPDTFAKA